MTPQPSVKTGKKHTAETKRKQSLARTGKTNSSITRQRIAAAKLGVPRPEAMVRGNAAKLAQFNSTQVQQIRDDRAAGLTLRAIAKKYNCLLSTSHRVVNGTGLHYSLKGL